MNARNRNAFGEKELAALNASAEATLLQDADDWEDVTLDTGIDCATLCEQQGRGWSSGSFDND